MRIVDRYSCLLLDMNGTFMFRQDRFGTDADFYATYRSLGGNTLSPREVEQAIRRCYDGLCELYEEPARYDDFPGLREGLQRFSNTPPAELSLLEAVFAHHECGVVPEEYAKCIHELAQTHRLGLVANIWAPKPCWLKELERAGISDCFRTLVFSSDSRSMKPSPKLFDEALNHLSVNKEEALFIGDSLRCDIEGASGVGLATVWITNSDEAHPSADFRVTTLLELPRLGA